MLSLITDPYKTFKDQALKIWDTKDFAERLAFNRTSWFLALMWCFMGVTILHLFIVIAVSDLFILANYYSSTLWYVDFLEELFYQTTYLQIALIFFWVSAKVVRIELLIWKAYANKETGFSHWLEFKIKQRFPNYKTSTQRARERLDKPKKDTKLGKWLKSRPPIQRHLIRASIWICWAFTMFSIMFFLFSTIFEKTEQMAEIVIEEPEQLPPTKPTGRPPPTIYDIFINEPDLVIP